MMRYLPIVLFILLTPTIACGAEPASTAALRNEVRRLILQLDDDQASVRQTAETRLEELGPQVLPLLPGKSARVSPEVRRRLTRIVAKLQEAWGRQVTAASRVTLQGSMTVANLMQAVETQTGNRLSIVPESTGDRQIDVDLDNREFWPALDRVLDQLQGSIDLYGGQAGVLRICPAIDPNASRTKYVCYAGPFRVAANEIVAVRNLQSESTSSLRLHLEVVWEPRLRPIVIKQPLAAVTVVDDQQASVEVINGDAVISAMVQPGTAGAELNLPLSLPSRAARHLATVRGRLSVLLPGKTARFEFPELAKSGGPPKRIAGVAIGVDRVLKNEDVTEIRLRLHLDGGAVALQSHFGWLYQNEAYLQNPDGTRIDHAGVQLVERGENEIVLSYLFPVPELAAKAKLIYVSPTLMIEKDVPFELTRLPLP